MGMALGHVDAMSLSSSITLLAIAVAMYCKDQYVSCGGDCTLLTPGDKELTLIP